MPIKLLCSLLLITTALASHARTATTVERKTCEAKIQPKLDAIDSRLRAGYSASEGEQLKQRRRKLMEQREACRWID
jgi:uncharacterized protein